MARGFLKGVYIFILSLTVVFAIVELGLAADLINIMNQILLFGTIIRPRTRYLVYCSVWGILAGIVLLMLMCLADDSGAIIGQVVVMFMSMIFWLLGASLFTSAIGGSGIDCGGRLTCNTVNIVNSTLAFAWINWSFVMIGFLLSLALIFFGANRQQKATTDMRAANTTGPGPNIPTGPPQTTASPTATV